MRESTRCNIDEFSGNMKPNNIISAKRFLGINMTFQQKDLEDLKKAKSLLENPGFAAKITNLLGTPIEKGFASLP
jgi:hypothetical protein